MYGGNGRDLLVGGAGADILFGFHGDDTLWGAEPGATDGDSDILRGGDGFDTYQVGGGDYIVDSDGSGQVYLGDQPVTLEELEAELQKAHEESPDTLVEMKGDERAFHGDVMRVMDVVNSAGFETIGVGLEQPQ